MIATEASSAQLESYLDAQLESDPDNDMNVINNIAMDELFYDVKNRQEVCTGCKGVLSITNILVQAVCMRHPW